MIDIKIFKSNDSITGFLVSGHAEFAPHGSDIVCAAVSALAQSTVLGIETFVKCKNTIALKDGFLTFNVDSTDKDRFDASQLLLQTMELSLKNISQQYQNHIRMETVEQIKTEGVCGSVSHKICMEVPDLKTSLTK